MENVGAVIPALLKRRRLATLAALSKWRPHDPQDHSGYGSWHRRRHGHSLCRGAPLPSSCSPSPLCLATPP